MGRTPGVIAMNTSARPTDHRAAYVSSWPPERFIVPMLAERVPELFHRFCPPPRINARALDAGCGMQPFKGMIKDSGYDYLGMDVVQNRAGTVGVLGALDEPLPVELRHAAPFDFILCTEVLEHVARWSPAFANFVHLLAPGGRILITCPHFYPLHETPYDFWRPTPHAIEHFARESGLQLVYIEKAGGPREVLGTLLAETHCYPNSGKLPDRIAAAAARMIRAMIIHCLHSKSWSSRISFQGPYYLANLAVLQKTGGTSVAPA
jgi:SAM-dependent methyltransferase